MKKSLDLLRTWRTIRHLSKTQVLDQVYQRVRRQLPAFVVKNFVEALPPYQRETPFEPRPEERNAIHLAQRPRPKDLASARKHAAGQPRFLGVSSGNKGPRTDWTECEAGRLWAFHLHYLDAVPLLAGSKDPDDPERALQLLRDWKEHNPPGTDPAWEPYPLSRRSINLVRTRILCGQHEELGALCDTLLAQQSAVLLRSVENHLRANHLFTNLKALALSAALLPNFPLLQNETDWIWKVLREELHEQFLPDGGHFERSPMYHSQLTGDLCELAAILPRHPKLPPLLGQELRDTRDRALQFLATVRHPDGGLPFFHDGNLEESLDVRKTLSMTSDPGEGLHSHPQTGFFVARAAPWHLIWFCGPVGPDYQPGHAHADILSMELSLGKRRLFVNTGVAGYGEAKDREYIRSTGAHNTARFPGHEQLELWKSFRVGRRGRPSLLRLEHKPGILRLGGRYRWPDPCKGLHRRQIELHTDNTHTVFVRDFLEGVGAEGAEVRYHLHPDVRWDRQSSTIRVGDEEVHLLVRGGVVRGEPSTWQPRFGQRRPSTCLVIERATAGKIELKLSLPPGRTFRTD